MSSPKILLVSSQPKRPISLQESFVADHCLQHPIMASILKKTLLIHHQKAPLQNLISTSFHLTRSPAHRLSPTGSHVVCPHAARSLELCRAENSAASCGEPVGPGRGFGRCRRAEGVREKHRRDTLCIGTPRSSKGQVFRAET